MAKERANTLHQRQLKKHFCDVLPFFSYTRSQAFFSWLRSRKLINSRQTSLQHVSSNTFLFLCTVSSSVKRNRPTQCYHPKVTTTFLFLLQTYHCNCRLFGGSVGRKLHLEEVKVNAIWKAWVQTLGQPSTPRKEECLFVRLSFELKIFLHFFSDSTGHAKEVERRKQSVGNLSQQCCSSVGTISGSLCLNFPLPPPSECNSSILFRS